MNFKFVSIVAFLIFYSFNLIASQIDTSTIISKIEFNSISKTPLTTSPHEVPLLTKTTQKVIKKDLLSDIQTLFLTGYYQKVEASTIPTNNQIVLNFELLENPRIKKIVISGNNAISSRKIRKLLSNKKNELLNINEISKDHQRITNYYLKKGYDLATVEDLSIDANQNINIKIFEGTIKSIDISGLDSIPDSIIKRELELTPDSIFNSLSLRRDRNRLINLGYFSEVSSPKLVESSNKESVSISFDVTEKKANRIDLGIEQDNEQVVGFIKTIRNHNLIPSDFLSIKLQAGTINSDFKANQYTFRYHQPWLFNRFKVSMTTNVWSELEQEINSTQTSDSTIPLSTRVGEDISFGFPIYKESFTWHIKYKNETVTPEDEDSTIDHYQLQSLSSIINFQSIKNQQFSNQGTYANFEYEKGGNLGAFTFPGLDFSRALAKAATFIKLNKKTILGAHTSWGIFRPNSQNQSTFETESFLIGGTNSLRGYKESNPFSGTRKIVFNTEYRYQAFSKLQLVAFYDVGKTFDDGFSFNYSSFSVGKGIGIRFFTPAGPLRLDVARGETDTILHFGLGQLF